MSEDIIKAFLDSYDFMRLGQAISHRDQSTAMMIVTHLQKAAEEADLTDLFDQNLRSLRQCIIGGDVKQAQDILAVVTAKRVKLISDRKRAADRAEDGEDI